MTVGSDIAEYLEDQGIGTVGTTIVINQMPAGPDTIVAVFETGGMPAELLHDGNYDENPSIQVRVRGPPKGYAAGRAKAEAVVAALHGVSNSTIESTAYKLIRAMSSPAFIGDGDGKGRPEWTINFLIVKAP